MPSTEETYASMFSIEANTQNGAFLNNSYNSETFNMMSMTCASLTNGATQN